MTVSSVVEVIMKARILIMAMLMVIVLASCSPVNAPIPQKTAVQAPILPTTLPTPFSAPGSAHAAGNAWMEIYQDFSVGARWSVRLHKGERALLDREQNVMEVQDVQGRVKLENLGGYRYRFYAWEDGFDELVCGGQFLLKAGNSYTQNVMSNTWDTEVMEIRLISTDQLVGYKLLMKSYDSDNRITGLETPIAFIDSNGDGLVSMQELDIALKGLRQEVNGSAGSQPSLPAKHEIDINAAAAAMNSGAIGDAYQKIKQIYAEQAAAAKQTTMTQICFGIVAVTFLVLVAGMVGLLKRSKVPGQPVNAVPNISEKVANEIKQEEILDAQPEPEPEPDPSIIICPICGYSPRPNELFCRKCGEKLR
jgi:hypothetical protein